MKAIRIIGIILLIIVAVFIVGVAIQPSKGHVEQSTVINAPLPTVYKTLNTYRNFSAWAPWSKMDPQAKYTFEGPDEGVGAKMSWDGERTGKGSQWIEESIPDQKVKSVLVFEGIDDKAYSEFILTPQGGGTTLTWTYDGENKGVKGKAMWMFMGTMLNDQYIQGLADLKAYIENQQSDIKGASN